MKIEETGQVLAMLTEAFPDRGEASQARVSIWHEALKDLDFDLIKKAVYRIILTKTFFPAIAEVRRVAIEFEEGALPSAALAWRELKHAVRRYGTNQEYEAFSSSIMSPITRYVVASMDWQSICNSENEPALRAHFFQLFEEAKNRLEEERSLPETLRVYLPGPQFRALMETLEEERQKKELEEENEKKALPEKTS